MIFYIQRFFVAVFPKMLRTRLEWIQVARMSGLTHKSNTLGSLSSGSWGALESCLGISLLVDSNPMNKIQEHQNWAPRASKMRSKFSGRKAHRGEVHSNRSTSSIWKSHHEKKINDVCPQINKMLPQTLHNSGKISQNSFLEPSEEPLGTLPWNTPPFPKHLFLFFVLLVGFCAPCSCCYQRQWRQLLCVMYCTAVATSGFDLNRQAFDVIAKPWKIQKSYSILLVTRSALTVHCVKALFIESCSPQNSNFSFKPS